MDPIENKAAEPTPRRPRARWIVAGVTALALAGGTAAVAAPGGSTADRGTAGATPSYMQSETPDRGGKDCPNRPGATGGTDGGAATSGGGAGSQI